VERLDGKLLRVLQREDAGFDLRAEDQGFADPVANRVRLDVETGVCLTNEQLGVTRRHRSRHRDRGHGRRKGS
jgi:hypothetical protein